LLDQGAENKPADPAETIDAHFHSHVRSAFFVSRIGRHKGCH